MSVRGNLGRSGRKQINLVYWQRIPAVRAEGLPTSYCKYNFSSSLLRFKTLPPGGLALAEVTGEMGCIYPAGIGDFDWGDERVSQALRRNIVRLPPCYASYGLVMSHNSVSELINDWCIGEEKKNIKSGHKTKYTSFRY